MRQKIFRRLREELRSDHEFGEQMAQRSRCSSMSIPHKDDYDTRTEKENMDEPQEEFISDNPPSTDAAAEAPIHPNPEKDPDTWTTGDEPMTGPQMSYLKTLCQEAGTNFDEKLTKAEASKMIESLQQKTGRGQKA